MPLDAFVQYDPVGEYSEHGLYVQLSLKESRDLTTPPLGSVQKVKA